MYATLNRFIVGNDSNTYEWDTENDALVRKYNCVYYNCTAFFPNAAKDLAILVHRHNGVSFFRGSPAKLYAQLHIPDQTCQLHGEFPPGGRRKPATPPEGSASNGLCQP